MTNEHQVTTATEGSRQAPSITVAPAAVAGAPEPARAWQDCDLFCIGDYAGVGGRRCGWRGRFDETRWDPSRRVRPCPRCGEATLMELDFRTSPFRD